MCLHNCAEYAGVTGENSLHMQKMRMHAGCAAPARRTQSCSPLTTRRIATSYLARDIALRIALNIAKLPGLVSGRSIEPRRADCRLTQPI
jgi:hypothetical protein